MSWELTWMRLAGSHVNVLGGSIAGNFSAHAGSVVDIYGGTIGAGLFAALWVANCDYMARVHD